MDDLIVALRWQNTIHIVLSNEFDLLLFKRVMDFEVIKQTQLPSETLVWTFAMPKGGLSWFKWAKAELANGIDREVFHYVASGDIAALPHLNYNTLLAAKLGLEDKEMLKLGVGKLNLTSGVKSDAKGITIGGQNYR